MPHEDIPGNDPARQFFEEADRVSTSSRSEQLEWLEKLRELNADLPNIDAMVRNMDAYLQMRHQLGEISVEEAHLKEMLEAHFLSMLNELLSLPDSHWTEATDDDLRGLAQVAVLAHLYGPLRERCQEADAQERLNFIFENYLYVAEDES